MQRLWSKRNPDDDAFFQMRTFLPHSIGHALQNTSDAKQIPVSRLIAFAVDNEMTESANPFHYDISLPETPYVDFAYAAQAARLAKFMQRFRTGIGLDSLLLLRRDAGIPDRNEFVHAYRELLRMNIIEEYEPRNTRFRHYAGYKYARLVHNERTPTKKQFKRVEGKSTRGDAAKLRRRFEKKNEDANE